MRNLSTDICGPDTPEAITPAVPGEYYGMIWNGGDYLHVIIVGIKQNSWALLDTPDFNLTHDQAVALHEALGRALKW